MIDTTRQPISTTHHSDFAGHFCTPRSVSLQPLLRLMYLGYRFRWPNSRGAPLRIENYDVSSMHFGASNQTEYRTNVESDRLFSTLPTWTTSSQLSFKITPNDLRTVTSFCSNKSHRFNNRNFNFNSKYSKCNHQLNRKHFTVKRQVLPWFLAASMLSQLKQRRFAGRYGHGQCSHGRGGDGRTALDIGASSEAGWRWLKCWSCICFLLHGFYCYDSSCSSPISLRVLAFLWVPCCSDLWKQVRPFRDEGLPLNPAWSEHHNPSTEFNVADGIIEVGKASKWWTWAPWRYQLQ